MPVRLAKPSAAVVLAFLVVASIARPSRADDSPAKPLERRLPDPRPLLADPRGEPVMVFDTLAHTDRVARARFSPNGREIVTGSWDKTLRFWSAETGELLRTVRLPSDHGSQGMVNDFDVSPDGRRIVVGGASLEREVKRVGGEYLLMLDYASGEILDVAAFHKQVVTAVAFSPDGRRVVSGAGSMDQKFLVYDVATDGKLKPIGGGQMAQLVTGAAFVPGSPAVVAIDDGGELVQADTSRFMEKTKLSAFVGANFALPGADGEGLRAFEGAVIGSSLGARLAQLRRGKAPPNSGFTGLAVDPNGAIAAVGEANGAVQLIKLAPGASREPDPIPKESAGGPVYDVSFSPDGKRIAVASGRRVFVYDVATKARLGSFDEHDGNVFSVRFSPDGKRIVSTGGTANQVYVWDLALPRKVLELGGSASGTRVVALGVSKSGDARIAFGRKLRQGEIQPNDGGALTSTFDFDALALAPLTNEAGFVSARAQNEERGASAPSFAGDFITGRRLTSYLRTKDGRTIFGTDYGLWEGKRAVLQPGTRSYAIVQSADGRTVYAAFADGRIEIVDAASLKPIATLFVMPDDEWLLATPDGYYAASRFGARRVGWLLVDGVKRIPKFYPFEQFDLRQNRPDIVLARLAFASTPQPLVAALERAHARRLEKMGITEASLARDMRAPEVSIQTPAPVVSAKRVTLAVHASDDAVDLDRLHVYVNDVPVFGQGGVSVRGTRDVTKSIDVDVLVGRSKIQVSALNAAGSESRKETVYVTRTGAPEKPSLHVVAVGVSDYANDDYDLTYAAKDAKDLAKALGNLKGSYKSVHVSLLADKQAVKEKVLAAKAALLKSKPEDVAVVFVAGHGLLDEAGGYVFATHDLDFTRPAARGLAYDDLERLLDGIPARSKLLLMDTCHAGEIDDPAPPPRKVDGLTVTTKTRGLKGKGLAASLGRDVLGRLLGELFSDLRRGSGASVIASAGAFEAAIESDAYKNGVFTYALLRALGGDEVDKNRDRRVAVSELRNFVGDEVARLTAGAQRPTARRENIAFDFPVLTLSGAAPQGLEGGSVVASAVEASAARTDKGASAGDPVLVSFDSTPAGASVAIDGTTACSATPCKQLVTPGKHAVRVGGDCIVTKEETLVVKGEKQELSWPVEIAKAELRVELRDGKGAPVEGSVTLDGTPAGLTWSTLSVPVCGKEVEIATKEGTMKQAVTLRAREVTKVEATLRLCGRYTVDDEGTGKSDSGTGLVRDTKTNLAWLRFTGPNGLTQPQAASFCAGKGMRLPTKDEVLAIARESSCKAAWPSGWATWTSTSDAAGLVWRVLESGAGGAFSPDVGSLGALCVR